MPPRTALSRRITSPSSGKCDAVIKTTVTFELADLLTHRARELGYRSTADCLREIVEVALLGSEHVLSLHQRRIDALAQNRPDAGPPSAPRS